MAPDTQHDPRFPEGFKEFLEAHALPCPPLPEVSIAHFNEVTPTYYATTNLTVPQRFVTPEDAEYFLQEYARYVGFGVVGHGVQSKDVVFLQKAPHLLLAISLPWSRLYGDPEQERQSLQTALQLAEACQYYLATRTFDDDEQLSIMLTSAVGCDWTFTTATAYQHGNNLSEVVSLIGDLLGEQPPPAKDAWLAV